jgi:phosphoribosylpyrophosphate synthetase
MPEEFAILCGNANRGLARTVAGNVGVAVSDALVERFPDGEVSVDIESRYATKTSSSFRRQHHR